MKTCILSKWYINIILFLLFWITFMFYTASNQENLISCSTDITKQDLCKSHLEKWFLDSIIPKNSPEKIDTSNTDSLWSKSNNFFTKYGKFLWFAIWFVIMLIVFLLNWIKFIIWLWKFKFLNVISLFIWYFLVFLLWLEFLYWEPRYTETWVAIIVFLWHSLTLLWFYTSLVLLIIIVVRTIFYFLTKKKDEKNS